MKLSFDDARRLLEIARDASSRGSFRERVLAFSDALGGLVPYSYLGALSLERKTLAPTSPEHLVAQHWEPAVVERYASDYLPHDAVAPFALASPGVPQLATKHVPARLWGRDPYTSDLLGPARSRYRMASTQTMPGGLVLAYCLHRHPSLGDFEQRDAALLGLVLPDLGRAAFGAILDERLQRSLDPTTAETVCRSRILAFDATGDLVRAAPAAAALLAELEPGGGVPDGILETVRSLARGEDWRLERTLPRSDRGFVRGCFTRIGPPGSAVILELEPLQMGSPGYRDEVFARAGLTPRERSVASLAARGHGNKQIATLVPMSQNTVKGHLSNVYRKLGVSSRAGLVAAIFGVPEAPAPS